MAENVSAENKRQVDYPIRFKILVVDRQGSYLQSVTSLLRGLGYNIDAASDSDSTRRKLKNSVRPVDMLIIDLDCIHNLDQLVFLRILRKAKCCNNTQLIITTHTSIDRRLIQVRDELAISASFNKARPLEELLCLVTALLPPGGLNLRASRRVPVKFQVCYTVGANSRLHQATNLSLGGIFILNSQPDPVGTEVNLAFTLPGTDMPLKAQAKVVRVVQYALDARTLQCQAFPPGNGLVFVDMSEEHRRMLREFCDQEETRIFSMPTLMTNLPAIQGQEVR
jgi:uncharacterized protein (TIGR02266 family)